MGTMIVDDWQEQVKLAVLNKLDRAQAIVEEWLGEKLDLKMPSHRMLLFVVLLLLK